MPKLTNITKSLLFQSFLLAIFFAAVMATNALVDCQPQTAVRIEP